LVLARMNGKTKCGRKKGKRKRVRDSEGGVCGWSRAELVCYQRSGAVPSPAT